jgi:hypothetical protein
LDFVRGSHCHVGAKICVGRAVMLFTDFPFVLQCFAYALVAGVVYRMVAR